MGSLTRKVQKPWKNYQSIVPNNKSSRCLPWARGFIKSSKSLSQSTKVQFSERCRNFQCWAQKFWNKNGRGNQTLGWNECSLNDWVWASSRTFHQSFVQSKISQRPREFEWHWIILVRDLRAYPWNNRHFLCQIQSQWIRISDLNSSQVEITRNSHEKFD